MKFKLFVFLSFFISWIKADGQSFKWQADLGKVTTNGFYKIALTPQIISKTAEDDLADIRIYEKDKEIAYLIRKIADSLYTILPSPSVTVKEDKVKQQTILQITFNAPYQVDKMTINLAGSPFYRRTAWLTELNPLIRSKKNHFNDNKLVNFTISSGKPPVIELSEQKKYKQLFLVIENEESAPLLIKNIRAYQKNIELITYLEKDQQYVIKLGRINMQLPLYDLRYFSDSISNNIPYIDVLNFKVNKDEVASKNSGSIKKGWMWVAIGLLILLLGYLSYFVVKDMQRNK